MSSFSVFFKTIVADQDQGLEKIGGSLRTLRDMSHQIGSELNDQAE
jgi:hypothetical protein